MRKKSKIIPAGEFKAHCLRLMDEVNASKTSLVVTKHGKPVVVIIPFEEQKTFPIGCLRDETMILGDIVGPIDEQWNAEVDY